MKGRDLMIDYLEGHLSREDVQKKLTVRDAKNRDLLAKVDLDHRCRRVLSSLRPPDGAAERLAQVVLSPGFSSEVFQQNRRGSLLGVILQSMPFDVVGAGQPESKRGLKEKTKKKGKQKNKKK
jgi:hypothetical protein